MSNVALATGVTNVSPWIAFIVGVLLTWVWMRKSRSRLEDFIVNPEVHAELRKFAEAHAARDRAMKVIDEHRELERTIFCGVDPLSEEAARTVTETSRERWSASLNRVVVEEEHVHEAYRVWHAYGDKMQSLILKYSVNPELKLRLVLGYNPQVFPSG
jgi:hypothetical protein